MTENVQLNGLQNQNQTTASDNQSLNSSIPPQGQSQEKLLRQSEVNELIGREKHASYEKGRQEALASPPPPDVASKTTQQNTSYQSPEQIQQLVAQKVAEHLQQQQQQTYMQQTAQQLMPQIEDAKKRYTDFEDVTRKVDFRKMPEMLLLANETGIAGDVLYDLANNPSKIGTILALAQRDPDLARIEMQKLSSSIKQNQAAKEQPQVNSPLSQIKASNVGTDNGSRTIRDLRKQPWARG